VERLAAALDLDPSGREQLTAAARRAREDRHPSLRVPPELQPPPTRLVGREELVAEVCALLERPDVRLLTLTGAPGVGKTRVALEVAARLVERYPAGVIVAGLASLTDPDLVAPALLRALGAHENGAQPASEVLVARCRGRRLLLVLDNLEHLREAVPTLVELLLSCPGVRLLATSRVSLQARIENEYRVPPLPLPSRQEERAGTEALGAVSLEDAVAEALAPSAPWR
jgi:predicted ATPase